MNILCKNPKFKERFHIFYINNENKFFSVESTPLFTLIVQDSANLGDVFPIISQNYFLVSFILKQHYKINFS